MVGRTVGENRVQPFLFSDAKISFAEGGDNAESYSKCGTICIELWHGEFAS